MSWHKLTHKTSGEVQYVASLDGIDLEAWKAVPILADRAPEPWQTVDDTGKMATDLVAKVRLLRRAALARFSVVERLEAMEERIARLEELAGIASDVTPVDGE